MSSHYFTGGHINANAATAQVPGTVAGASTTLHTVVINTVGATANLLTIFNAGSAAACTAANTVAVIDTTIAAAPTRVYDIVCSNGLMYTLAAGTAADVTVTWS